MRVIVIAMCALGFVLPGFAADIAKPDQAPPAVPEPASVLENCAFVMTDCETCVVDEQGKPSCSSTGIACVPTKKTCLIRKKAE
jgi:hypothetical protein